MVLGCIMPTNFSIFGPTWAPSAKLWNHSSLSWHQHSNKRKYAIMLKENCTVFISRNEQLTFFACLLDVLSGHSFFIIIQVHHFFWMQNTPHEPVKTCFTFLRLYNIEIQFFYFPCNLFSPYKRIICQISCNTYLEGLPYSICANHKLFVFS